MAHALLCTMCMLQCYLHSLKYEVEAHKMKWQSLMNLSDIFVDKPFHNFKQVCFNVEEDCKDALAKTVLFVKGC